MSKEEDYKGIWTQGSTLSMVAKPFGKVTETKIIEIEGVTALTPPEVSKNKIDITTIKDKSKKSRSGLAEAGEASFTVILNTEDEGHQYLIALNNDETSASEFDLQIIMGLDDGDSEPTLTAEGELDLPEDRTWFTYKGTLKSFNILREDDSVIKNEAKLEVSGKPKLTPKTK